MFESKQTPKFVTKKKNTELAKPLTKISLNFKLLTKEPITTATVKEIYVKNIVLWKPKNKSPINIEKITINVPKNKFLK